MTDELERAAQDALREEIRPVVREALTEDVLGQLARIVSEGLPRAVAAAIADLENEDDLIRQRAYMLLFKHTVGSSAIVPDLTDARQQALNVTFNLPRPEPAAGLEPAEGESGVIETKECDSCGDQKTLDQFVGASDRCQECFAKMRASAAHLLGGTP